MHNEHKMKIFACRSSKPLAEKIVKALGTELGKSEVLEFSDGEFQPSFNESVRGATVFIVQSTFPPVENLFELLLMIDAAKRASAHTVIAVMPYFGWARQDRKDKPRVSIGAKLVANLLHAAGCDRVMTCDLHADQIQGFFRDCRSGYGRGKKSQCICKISPVPCDHLPQIQGKGQCRRVNHSYR